LGRAQSLLNRQRPASGQTDLRGWEWRYLWTNCQNDALFHLQEQGNPITSLSVSHDGKWLAVGDRNNGRLTLWDLLTRRTLTLTTGNQSVQATFSPREPLLAYSCQSGVGTTNRHSAVRLWNIVSQETVGELHLRESCLALAFSNDGQKLITQTSTTV